MTSLNEKTQDQNLRSVPRTPNPVKDCIDFLRDIKTYHQRCAEQSSVLDSGVSYLRAILLFGPEANAHVLNNREQIFSSKIGWEIMLEKVFPGSVMAMDGDHHRYQRRIMNYAFKKNVLVNYLGAMNPNVDALIDQWQCGSDFLVFNHTKQLTLDLASSTFMGIQLDDDAKKINQSFIDMVEASITPIRVAIPFTPMWKGVKGRAHLVKFLSSMLEQKRSVESADFFSQFCHAISEDGEQFTDDEIVDHMAFLMMAAHDTTTSTLTTMFYLLAKHPEWQEKIREESLALNKKHLEFDDLNSLPSCALVMQETLRMYPPLPAIIRATTEDTEFDGYHIPKNTTIGLSPIHTHFMPEFWSQPEKFDPMRFSAERNEHKNHSHCYIPFGGGAHKCLGQHFAEMQVKSIIHQVVQRFKWSVADDYQMPYQRVPIGKPKDKLPVKLEKLN